MSCPFSGAKAPEGGGGCPFANAARSAAPAPTAAGGGTGALAAAPPAADAAPPQPAVCPFGFSSRAGGSRHLSELHCTLCKSLMFAAARAQPCGHPFCGACVAGARECPVCGRDVDSLQPDAELQGGHAGRGMRGGGGWSARASLHARMHARMHVCIPHARGMRLRRRRTCGAPRPRRGRTPPPPGNNRQARSNHTWRRTRRARPAAAAARPPRAAARPPQTAAPPPAATRLASFSATASAA